MSGQTHVHSVIETCAGTAIGYGVAVVSQIAIFPWFGIVIPVQHNFALAGAFTAISLVRGYVVRRAFNRWHVRAQARREVVL